MHKMAMEIGKKVMEEAKAKGLDNFNAEDWEKLKYTMEIVKNAICADKDYRIVCHGIPWTCQKRKICSPFRKRSFRRVYALSSHDGRRHG